MKQLEVIKTDNLTGAMYHSKLIKEGSVDSWDLSAGSDCQPAAGERDVESSAQSLSAPLQAKQEKKKKHQAPKYPAQNLTEHDNNSPKLSSKPQTNSHTHNLFLLTKQRHKYHRRKKTKKKHYLLHCSKSPCGLHTVRSWFTPLHWCVSPTRLCIHDPDCHVKRKKKKEKVTFLQSKLSPQQAVVSGGGLCSSLIILHSERHRSGASEASGDEDGSVPTAGDPSGG